MNDAIKENRKKMIIIKVKNWLKAYNTTEHRRNKYLIKNVSTINYMDDKEIKSMLGINFKKCF